jgi:hypothetical protein
MNRAEEADRFRQIELNEEIAKARRLVHDYRGGIDFYRDKIDRYFKELGRLAERLGEPEERAS